jgi:hypothetical protein
VRALVCYLCVHQHLPVDRAAQLLADVLCASVATGTLAAAVAEGAGAVRRAPAARAGGNQRGARAGLVQAVVEAIARGELDQELGVLGAVINERVRRWPPPGR